jgi:hypothetical protein
MRRKNLGGMMAVVLLAAGPLAQADTFKVWSPDVIDGHFSLAQVFNRSDCRGANVPPRLEWSGEPAGTQSFVVTLFDPDARSGLGWWHWVVSGIPATVHRLQAATGLPPGAVETRNDFGLPGYGGPCPPHGAPHHYTIDVYAIGADATGINVDTPPATAASLAVHSSIGKASQVVLYAR